MDAAIECCVCILPLRNAKICLKTLQNIFALALSILQRLPTLIKTHAPGHVASCRASCQVPTTLAVIKVQGDGDCLFHALAFCSGSDGGALRIEVADFLEEEALNQDGFEEAWLEEADKIRRSE